jgi:hypothetical protein
MAYKAEGDQKMKFSNDWMKNGLVLAAGILWAVSAQSTGAQVQTTTQVQSGQSTEVVRVDHGEVMAVEGNDLIVKMENGSVRHFENIPESAKVTVDGRLLGVHDLRPGMKLQRTITTTTTPQLVTTIQSVTGKVWYIAAPSTVILTLENGTNQSFKIPKDQKFNVDGQMVDAFGLKKGMMVTATKIVEVPISIVSQDRNVTGTMPPMPAVSQAPAAAPASLEKVAIASEEKSASAPAPGPMETPAADAPLLVAEGPATAVPSQATETPAPPAAVNPMTGYLPYVGLGLLLLIVFLIASASRRKSET